jgi:hypothetical protein
LLKDKLLPTSYLFVVPLKAFIDLESLTGKLILYFYLIIAFHMTLKFAVDG